MLGELIGGVARYFTSKDQQRENERAQKEFAQHGIRWKVEDAQRAGVHPLFALGGSTQGFAPNPVVPHDFGIPEAAASLDERNKTVAERGHKAAQLKLMESQTENNFAEASYWRSKAATERQSNEVKMPFPEMYTDQVKYKNAQYAGDVAEDKFQVWNPYSDAIIRRVDPELWDSPDGVSLPERGGLENLTPHPGWTAFDFGEGPLVVFSTQEGQLMESLSEAGPLMIEMLIAENNKRYGPAGAARLRKLISIAKERPTYGGSRERNPRVGPGGGYMPRQ